MTENEEGLRLPPQAHELICSWRCITIADILNMAYNIADVKAFLPIKRQLQQIIKGDGYGLRTA